MNSANIVTEDADLQIGCHCKLAFDGFWDAI